jgi:hypothetical protein
MLDLGSAHTHDDIKLNHLPTTQQTTSKSATFAQPMVPLDDAP